jgi:hypothetical protein
VNLDYAKGLHARFLTNKVTVRRYVGSPGPNRTTIDADCRASIRADPLRPQQMVSDVTEFVFRCVVLAEDIEAGGIAAPLTIADKVIYQGKEMAISFPDGATRTIEGELIAYNIRVRG